MKKGLKILALVLVFAMCVFAFAACSSQKAEDTAEQAQDQVEAAVDDAASAAEDAAQAVTGDVCDTGAFSVTVPAGWKAFPQSDPNKLKIYKGASSEDDMYTKSGIDLTYSASGSYYLVTGVFDSYEEVDALTIGDRTWSGAAGAYSSTKNLTSLSTVEGDGYFAADVWDVSGENISVDDADVQAILSSLTVDAAE
ncbi:MAG: hypothetical protein IIY69_07900 [Clostridia bacterium]|nr:hypothetical protein [Clostridia bacterium]